MEHLLIPPHGSTLVNRVLSPEHAQQAQQEFASGSMVSIALDEEQIKSVKNICRGVLSPLAGFMSEADFKRVIEEMKLSDGTVWPIPFVLDVSESAAARFKSGDRAALVDSTNHLVAILSISDIYTYDAPHVVKSVFGTADAAHPGVAQWLRREPMLVGGVLDLVDNSKEPFYEYNLDPAETRVLFNERGWKTVAGFQTRNVPHRAHEYLQRCALELCDGLFINPIIGKKKAGDFEDEVIVSAYDYMIKNYFPKESAVFSILPAAMHYAGPREAILHAIIRKNFGCTHFVVGRDHAGVGDYYHSTAAQEIFDTIEDIGVQILRFDHSFYCRKCACMATGKTCGHAPADRVPPSGTKIRQLISSGQSVPPEIMRPDVVELLLKSDHQFVPENDV